ncbi:MAG: DUF1569 domain-containing protein [Fluviicola sp.]
MSFIEPNLETLLSHLDKLTTETQPQWGNMSAQRMVEHLSEMLRGCNGKVKMELSFPEEKIESMQRFLSSDKPMARNIEVPFAGKDVPLRHEELELAIDEFVDEWLDFEQHFETEGQVETHPFYGSLNKELWLKLHSKHFTHHFEQFGLIEA